MAADLLVIGCRTLEEPIILWVGSSPIPGLFFNGSAVNMAWVLPPNDYPSSIQDEANVVPPR
jgi:hypothetical protein